MEGISEVIIFKDEMFEGVNKIVAKEAEVPDVAKVREGGRDVPSEVVILKEEIGEGVKCSELSRERAFEAIIVSQRSLREVSLPISEGKLPPRFP